ncbi:DUF397 domain-containing protein [Streptosporangium sp. NBC_01495]|uniref:DUF397 domain-containing protein n=1 Tax=Streptosporangium sp. NBC_01495 TaxID=2903899 RepID=UPI002E318615|nr:DUF397 domain-containing protein [Streptosporangium sp. NBC_01495]
MQVSCEELSRAVWRKSTRSGGNGGSCVEVASLTAGRIGVRDSKDRSGPSLIFSPAEWHAFIGGIKGGEFDDPAI